jgi:hypothetical protein
MAGPAACPPGRDCHAATTDRHPQKSLLWPRVSEIIMFSRLLVSHPECRAVLIQIVALYDRTRAAFRKPAGTSISRTERASASRQPLDELRLRELKIGLRQTDLRQSRPLRSFDRLLSVGNGRLIAGLCCTPASSGRHNGFVGQFNYASRSHWKTGRSERMFGGWKRIARVCLRSRCPTIPVGGNGKSLATMKRSRTVLRTSK